MTHSSSSTTESGSRGKFVGGAWLSAPSLDCSSAAYAGPHRISLVLLLAEGIAAVAAIKSCPLPWSLSKPSAVPPMDDPGDWHDTR